MGELWERALRALKARVDAGELDPEDVVTRLTDTILHPESPTYDPVNHPRHYVTGGIETIDFIEAKLGPERFEGYCIGNAIKYLSRYQHKGGKEDLEKAVWYLNRIIERSQEA
ncbi:DUF3310 domain-containing protein [Alicyclobacillus sendaiensis]|uniref:DUF3310 domain-containing protein n=1 Tax=Alicyclobacillus sendaiensis TaxID=192387 RepID=UPI0009FB418E|nr:DUF3310 domain-containing protein [Alicyclobacillus sendaiensis]